MRQKTILSYLMTLAAVLYMGSAFAQAWPASVPSDVVFQDTIYVCYGAKRPVELKYDAKSTGKAWNESLGSWTLRGMTTLANASGYIDDKAVDLINGNVFNTVAAQTGAYVFQFLSTSTQCSLPKNSKAWVYVFVLPKLDTVLLTKQICSTDLPRTVTVDNTLFSAHEQDVLTKGNITITGNPVSFSLTTANTPDTFTSDITLTAPSFFSCNKVGKITYQVSVISEADSLKGTHKLLCPNKVILDDDTFLESIFKNDRGGSYSPDKVIASHVTAGRFVYKYTYNHCSWGSKTISDTLIFDQDQLSKDTVKISKCNLPDNSALDLLTAPYMEIPNLAPYIWSNFGQGGILDLGTQILPDNVYYREKVGFTTAYINPSKMMRNYPYYFGFKVDPSQDTCFGNQSGVVRFIITSAFKAVDYRVQMCKTATDFDLGVYTGLNNAKWSLVTPVQSGQSPLSITNSVIKSADLTSKLGVGTHKIKYSVDAGDCGKDSAMLYLKIDKQATYISRNVTIQYCFETSPVQFNVNDLIGLAGGTKFGNGNWTLVSSMKDPITNTTTNAGSYFTTATGEFDLLNFKGETEISTAGQSATGVTLTFKLAGADCLSGDDITLTVKLSNTIVD